MDEPSSILHSSQLTLLHPPLKRSGERWIRRLFPHSPMTLSSWSGSEPRPQTFTLSCALWGFETPDPPLWKMGLLVSCSCGKETDWAGERHLRRLMPGDWTKGRELGSTFLSSWRLEALSINSCHGCIYWKVPGLIVYEALSSTVGQAYYTSQWTGLNVWFNLSHDIVSLNSANMK